MQIEGKSEQFPLVSVVLATYNEVADIQKCLDSLRNQETPNFTMEILAVDGISTDGTREYLQKIAREDQRIRIYENENRSAPFAFNIGIRASTGSFVCIFGSHAIYAKDYISVCLKELLTKDVAGCSARVFTEPASKDLQARLVAYAFSHPFGSSGKSWRTQPEGYGEALGYLIYRKEALLEVGGYSEKLLRNQDNDLNEKILRSGHKLYCTWKTRCFYQPKERLQEFFKYAYRTGYWNLISFKQNSSSMHLRHFVPFFFVLGLLATLFIAAVAPFIPSQGRQYFILPFVGILLLHLGAGTVAALKIAFVKKDAGALLVPFAFFGFHAAYGLGTLIALLTRAKAPGETRKSVAESKKPMPTKESAEAVTSGSH